MKKKKLGLVIGLIFCVGIAVIRWGASAAVPVPGQDCFYAHVDGAIDLYRERKRLRHDTSGGRTDALYNSILFQQHLLYPVAVYFDFRAFKYQKRGIPVLCADFVDLSETADIQDKSPAPWPVANEFHTFEIKPWVEKAQSALDAHRFEEVAKMAAAKFKDLAAQPGLNCMLRHLVESMGRMAKLAPQYAEKANTQGMASPLPLMSSMIGLHLRFLEEAHNVDQKAMEFQVQGIPVICNDLPVIPMDFSLVSNGA